MSWALHDPQLQPLKEKGTDAYAIKLWAEADAAWQKLMALPPAEQRSQIVELHAAALSCAGYKQMQKLAGEASQ